MWSDNKVCRLTTMFLPWQQWTETSVWFDDIGISVFHSCVVVDYGSLFLSGIYYCVSVFWCAVMRMSELFVELGKSGSKIREMLVQAYRGNAMKKTEVYKWVTCFSEGRGSVTDKERSRRPAKCRTEENIANVPQIVHENRWLSGAEQSIASKHQQRNS
jgi:hypothetical protein